MIERRDADVCVIGAGYAGLTAARRLAQGGASVVVVEARDRVGGRVWTRYMEDGAALDLGGTWLGPGQDAAYGLVEVVVPEGLGSPWHVHPEEDEWFFFLEGELTFWVGDTRLSLRAGSFGFGPKGVPHTFYAETGGARALVGFAPMQFEGFQREVGEPALARVLPPPAEGHPDMARLAPIAKQNGFEILGPPGPPPGH